MSVSIHISTADTGTLSTDDVKILSAVVAAFGGTVVSTELASAVEEATTPAQQDKPDTEEKPKRRRRTKAQIEAEAKAEENSDDAATDTEAQEGEGDGPTVEDAIARAQELVGKKLTPQLKEVVASMGAERVSLLKAEQVAEFLDRVKDLDAEPADDGI